MIKIVNNGVASGVYWGTTLIPLGEIFEVTTSVVTSASYRKPSVANIQVLLTHIANGFVDIQINNDPYLSNSDAKDLIEDLYNKPVDTVAKTEVVEPVVVESIALDKVTGLDVYLKKIDHQNGTKVTAKSTGIIVPIFWNISDGYADPAIEQLIELCKTNKGVPVIAAIDDASGPGLEKDVNIAAAVRRLKGAGVSVVGYVNTAETTRDSAAVKNDMSTWLSFYPELDGFWYGNTLATTDVGVTEEDLIAYYSALTTYAKKELGSTLIVANPEGLYLPEIWQSNIADIFVMYENIGYPTEQYLEQDGGEGSLIEQPVDEKAVLIQNAASLTAANINLLRKHSGWVYVTHQNGYTQLSSHISSLFSLLNSSEIDTSDLISKSTLTAQTVKSGLVLEGPTRFDSSIRATGLASGTATTWLALDSNGNVVTAVPQLAAAVSSINGESGEVTLNSDDIPEGSTNLFFTADRVREAALAGLVETSGVLLASDNVLTAFGKVKKSLTTKEGSLGLPASAGLYLTSDTAGQRAWAALPAPTWGSIVGSISDASELVSALNTKQDLSAELTAIANIGSGSGLLKKTGISAWALDTNTYLTQNQTVSLSGDAIGSGRTSIVVTLVDTGVAAGSYGTTGATIPTLTVDSKGRVTSASEKTLTLSSLGANLQTITAAGSSTSRAIVISNLSDTTGIGTGALSVAGGLFVGRDALFVGNIELSQEGTESNHAVTKGYVDTNLLNKENKILAGNSSQFYRGDKQWATLNTSAVVEDGNLYYTDARVVSLLNTLKDTNNGIPFLDANGKIKTTALPELSITSVSVVNNESEMLSLTAQPGDVAIRSDESLTYILKDVDPSNLASWQVLPVPASPVLSVNSLVGNVVLSTADVAEGASLYFTEERVRSTAVGTISPDTGSVTSSDSISNAISKLSNNSANYQPISTALSNISALSSTGILTRDLNGDIVIDSSAYITENQTITLSGDVQGSGRTAITTTLANSGVSAGDYGNGNSVPVLTIDAKGRVTEASVVPISASSILADLQAVTSVSGTTNVALTLTNNTPSTDPSTGALVLTQGGLGVFGDVRVGNGLFSKYAVLAGSSMATSLDILNASTQGVVVKLKRANGTLEALTPVTQGDVLFDIQAVGRLASSYSNARAGVLARSSENWGATNQGASLELYATNTGSQSRRSVFVKGDGSFQMGFAALEEQSATVTPPAGLGYLYNKPDGKLYYKNTTGSEFDLTAGTDGVSSTNKDLSYDTEGKLSTLVDSNGTKTFNYDVDGKLLSITGTGIYQSKVLVYTNGRLTAVNNI